MALLPITLLVTLLATGQGPGGRGDWPRVSPDGGGFSVMAPGRVERKSESKPTENGPAPVRAIVANADGILFVATETLSPVPIAPEKQGAYFDSLRETYAAARGNVLQKEQRGTFQGMPMCYYRFTTTGDSGKPLVVQARFLIADPTRLLSLQVFIPKGVDINAEVKRFFESLQVSERPTRPAAPRKLAKPGPGAADEGLGPAVAAKWRTFAPAGKGFSVAMPGEPKYRNQDSTSPPMKVDTYAADLGDRLFSAVAYEFPGPVGQPDPAASLEKMCDDLATGMKGKSAEIKEVRVDGLVGREVFFEFAGPDRGKPAIGRARAFLDGSRAFVVLFNGPKGSEDHPEVKKYLDSFRLVRSGPAAKGKAKARS